MRIIIFEKFHRFGENRTYTRLENTFIIKYLSMLPLYMNILCENNYPLITLPGNGNEFFSSSSFFTKKKKKKERMKKKKKIGRKRVRSVRYTCRHMDSRYGIARKG